jgi:hypothetical protein
MPFHTTKGGGKPPVLQWPSGPPSKWVNGSIVCSQDRVAAEQQALAFDLRVVDAGPDAILPAAEFAATRCTRKAGDCGMFRTETSGPSTTRPSYPTRVGRSTRIRRAVFDATAKPMPSKGGVRLSDDNGFGRIRELLVAAVPSQPLTFTILYGGRIVELSFVPPER